MNYETLRLDKSFYKNSSISFAQQLEALDPSTAYKGGELEGLDAFGRQLKRFDIKVSGAGSDRLEKFFRSSESAALFPEYVTRAVRTGMEESRVLDAIVATKTKINSMDYRTISTDMAEGDLLPMDVLEGGEIPRTTIKLRDSLVQLKKRGRMIEATYEAIKFQVIDLLSVAIRQIGGWIVKRQLADALEVLLAGDGNGNPAQELKTAGSGKLEYADLVALWSALGDFQLNTIIASPDMAVRILNLPEFKNPVAGADFGATGKLVAPLGANLITTSALGAGKIIGLDRRYALEMVVASDVAVEHDKLINCQLERAAITSIAGFAKLFPDALKVLPAQEVTQALAVELSPTEGVAFEALVQPARAALGKILRTQRIGQPLYTALLVRGLLALEGVGNCRVTTPQGDRQQ